jgi:2-keto-4-pentenoate hydratase/2-oxohepta-3-ene-1,7-dioic acid hydratase in catechol pathway
MTRFFRIEHNGGSRHVIDEGGRWRFLEGELFDRYRPGHVIPSNGHRPLAPVVPSKIVAVGLNYRDHAAEQNKPLPAEPMISDQ